MMVLPIERHWQRGEFGVGTDGIRTVVHHATESCKLRLDIEWCKPREFSVRVYPVTKYRKDGER